MKLGEAIVMGQSKSIEIEDSTEYTIAGVQSYGKGVVNRRTELGKNLKMKKYQVIEPDYLMWCKVDTKNGAFGITKPEHAGSLASTNMALAKINTEKFNPYFLERLFTFDFFHGYITHLSSGSTNRKYLTPKQLSELVQLPNLSKEEQDDFIKLVDRIENLEISTELTHQLDLVKQLRQAFLREAMQGKLVPQDPNDEPASVLLEKIKAEKERLIKEKKIKKQKTLSPITENEIPFEIPENWVWCRLGDSGELKRGKSKHRPRNDEKLFKDGEYPFIQTGDVARSKANGYLISTINGYYNDFGLAQSEMQPEGTLCITIAANIAECGFLGFDACAPDSIVCYTSLEKVTERFAFYYLIDARDEIETYAPATAQKNINLGILNALLIPLPPFSEQQRIVAKLDELMRYCDELEASIKESQQQNELLLQQVLREALEPKEKEVTG